MIEIIATFVVGILTRIADMAADDGLKLNKFLVYATGALYGLLIAYIITQHPVLAELGIAVLLAVIFHPAEQDILAALETVQNNLHITPQVLIWFQPGSLVDENFLLLNLPTLLSELINPQFFASAVCPQNRRRYERQEK